jgi:hypothetical protein
MTSTTDTTATVTDTTVTVEPTMESLFGDMGFEVIARKSWYADIPAAMSKAFASAHTMCSSRPNTYRIYANVPGGLDAHHTVKVPAVKDTVDPATQKITKAGKPAHTEIVTNAEYFALQIKTYADMHDIAHSAVVDGATVAFRFANHRDADKANGPVNVSQVADAADASKAGAEAAAESAETSAANAAK